MPRFSIVEGDKTFTISTTIPDKKSTPKSCILFKDIFIQVFVQRDLHNMVSFMAMLKLKCQKQNFYSYRKFSP